MKTKTKTFQTRAQIDGFDANRNSNSTSALDEKTVSYTKNQEDLFECELKKNRLILNRISTPLLDIKISNKLGQTLDEYHLQDTKYAQINLGKYLSDIISVTLNIGNMKVKSFEHTRV